MIEHKEHKYDFVKKAAPKTKEKLSKNLAPLKEIQMSLHGAAQTVKSTKSAVEAQAESVATTIEQLFNELHEIIEQRKRELLEKAASMTKGKLDRLSVQEKGFEMASGTVQSLVDFVEQNIENATEEELMSIHTQVMNRISEETKKHQCSKADLEPVEKANLMVDVGCAMEVKKICQEKTYLFGISMDIPVMKDAEVGKSAAIQVSYKPSRNPLLIESKLVTVADGTVVKATAQQKRNDVYQIKCIPKVRGRHKLEITANGLPVPGSPFPVFVKIPPTQLGKPVKIIEGVEDPIDIAINSAGELLVAEEHGDVIIIDKSGRKVQSIQEVQHGFKRLRGIAVDKNDNIYLTDRGSDKLFKFNRNYELVTELGTNSAGGIVIAKTQDIIVGSQDLTRRILYILDRQLNFEKTIALETIGAMVLEVQGIAIDEHMNLYICNYCNGGIHVISLKDQGELLYPFGQKQLKLPHSIYTSGGRVYVSIWEDNKIYVFTKEGTLVTSFAIGSEGD